MSNEASNPLSEQLETKHCPSMSDQLRIISLALAGNADAQRLLYDQYRSRIYRLALRMVGADQADDVTQQIWLQVFRNLHQFKGKSRFQTWIYRLAVNECLQFRRKAARRSHVELVADPMDEKASPPYNPDDGEFLQKAMNRLESELRAVFILREIEHLSYLEIAETLHIAEGTVASRLNRARLELRVHLTALGWKEKS